MTDEEAVSYWEEFQSEIDGLYAETNKAGRRELDRQRPAVVAALTALREKMDREQNKPPTNADHLRNMSDEELGTWLIRMSEGDEHIKFCGNRPERTADLEQDREIQQERCAECMLFWLRQPYEEGTGSQFARISREEAEQHGETETSTAHKNLR